LYPLSRIPHVEHLLAAAISYFEIKNYIISILSFELRPPLPVPEFWFAGTGCHSHKQHDPKVDMS
jgi:hypothetical protein